MRQQGADIGIITETWLHYSVINQMEDYFVAHSPPTAAQGVVIIARKPIINCQPLLPDLWTPTIIMVLVHVEMEKGKPPTKVVVIAYYGKPDETKEQET